MPKLILYLVTNISYLSVGEGIKNTHPLNVQGWDDQFIPRFHPGCSEIAATHWRINGRTRRAISGLRLRSGIHPGRVTGALQQNGSLSGNLTGTACLHHSLL